MRRFTVALGIPAIILVIGCDSHKADAVAYAKAHARGLVSSTRSLRSESRRVITESEYPAEIRPLKPSQVVVNEQGVFIYLYSSPLHVTGIFVRHDPKFIPPAPVPDSDDWGYEPVSEDIFWFTRPR
jgi:hypothetical protein